MSIRPHRQGMYIKISGEVVCRFHDRRRGRHNRKSGTLSNPVDMPMTMHQHRSAGQRS
jgi:hypothetical protein